MKLIISTQNQGKLKEIEKLLHGITLPIISLADLPQTFQLIEDGTTFLENAIKKTAPVSSAYPDDLVAGEDSGLEVEHLNGAPGIISKRYSGENATDEKNNTKILTQLKNIPWAQRKARFRCILVLMQNGQLLETFEGIFPGYIAESIQGDQGFGYDPIFYIPSLEKTVAQIPVNIKNQLSHRAQAFNKLREFLLDNQ